MEPVILFNPPVLPKELGHLFRHLMAQTVKRLSAMQDQSLGREDPLEKEMAAHSRTLAWEIPRTEEPCRLQSTGSQRLGHD